MGTWQTLTKERAPALEAELAREVGSSHPLAKRSCRAVAMGEHPDDIAFIVDHVELWIVHLTWAIESSADFPHAARVLSRPVISFDAPHVLLALDLCAAFDEDLVTVDLAERVRRQVVFTIMLLMEMKGLSLGRRSCSSG